MRDVYMMNYSVKGIKSIDELITLSFYKKTIGKEMNIQGYNVKGIYGMNGSGKSGIMTSVDILRNILCNSGYLNNPIVQRQLDAIINKKLNELYIECDYVSDNLGMLMLFRYELTLAKDIAGKYVISHEKLSSKNAASKSDTLYKIIEVVDGKIVYLDSDDIFSIKEKMMNLLSTSSMCALFYEKVMLPMFNGREKGVNKFFFDLATLWIFSKKIHVYMDESDSHKTYFLRNTFEHLELSDVRDDSEMDDFWFELYGMQDSFMDAISIDDNIVDKDDYDSFVEIVDELYNFISIFKKDLKYIEIDKKEDKEFYVCNLNMVYDDYKINTEFESTGIKKLIKLFVYIKEMVNGGIVFIDEFDSNLHDVYLCALLEYLMAYGKGQLCFTTHNVGPMDILKQSKKSIDFLSNDQKIYPWTTNGNYSPSKLYRNGMIEGSPFNVDSIDFISAFGASEEDE